MTGVQIETQLIEAPLRPYRRRPSTWSLSAADPAGMAAALAAHKAGARVAIVEREQHLGGILPSVHPPRFWPFSL